MWQALRDELAPNGFELVTVGLDTLGAQGCRAYMEAAEPTHPALIDQHHLLADQFGVINIPSAIWIDEQGMIVRPAEAAPAPPKPPGNEPGVGNMEVPAELPQRFMEMMGEAQKIPNDAESYHAALRDWVTNGVDSEFAMTPDQVVARSRPRSADTALGHAHFDLATQLQLDGDESAAIEHFKQVHRLVPDSWTFRRQAWSLKPVGDGPLARFWQGPAPGAEDEWPYEGDWLSDVRAVGAENYSAPWKP